MASSRKQVAVPNSKMTPRWGCFSQDFQEHYHSQVSASRMSADLMLNLPPVQLMQTDIAFARLKTFGSSLKPGDASDAEDNWFFQIIFELIDTTLTNYDHLKTGYSSNNDHLLAWACRNLLELTVFAKYVLISEENARRFAQDRLIDGCDIIRSLKALELHLDPQSNTAPLDAALAGFQAQMVSEGVTAQRYLSTSVLAGNVGMREEYDCMNRVCSKLVHPTAWSIIAVNKGENAFSQARPLLFTMGAGYGCDLFATIRDHHAVYGIKPKR